MGNNFKDCPCGGKGTRAQIVSFNVQVDDTQIQVMVQPWMQGRIFVCVLCGTDVTFNVKIGP
ncbi:MAG: hypothetical protein A2901_07775 [Elusimicrobia bacterium RIFCSPLOWO2_01_FULL_54_10]|nr:MAG: hypothetical protein A2901_07775 [Elusimicrobia bacterium RIFCSPLOWO2_01_FULL_54_10]